MMGFNTISPQKNVNASDMSSIAPQRLCFLEINRIKIKKSQINPFSPNMVMMGNMVSVKRLCRFCCTKFMIETSKKSSSVS